jgi:anti-sigma factor RsiW
MLNELHVLESIPAYVLGSLEEDEARLVAEHLAGCYQCRKELETYQEVADQLLYVLPEVISEFLNRKADVHRDDLSRLAWLLACF